MLVRRFSESHRDSWCLRDVGGSGFPKLFYHPTSSTVEAWASQICIFFIQFLKKFGHLHTSIRATKFRDAYIWKLWSAILAFRRSDYRESWKRQKDVFCLTAGITLQLSLASIRLTLCGCVTFQCFSFSLLNPPPHVHWLKRPACWWQYWYQTTWPAKNCVWNICQHLIWKSNLTLHIHNWSRHCGDMHMQN